MTPTPCDRCGYELMGLKTGEVCPECGTPLSRNVLGEADAEQGVWEPTGLWRLLLDRIGSPPAAGIDSSMVDAPLGYLHRLALGSKLLLSALMLCGVAAVGIVLSAWWGGWNGFGTALVAGAFVGAAAGGPWIIGTWMVTSPRRLSTRDPAAREQEWRSARMLARAGAACVPLVLGALGVLAMGLDRQVGDVAALALRAGVVVLGAGAIASMAALSWYAARLAQWANDTGLSDRLQLATAGLVVAPLVIAFCVSLVAIQEASVAKFFGGVLALLASLVPLLWLWQFVAGSVQFISLARWAEVNADEKLAQAERLAVRRQRERERAERVRELEAMEARGVGGSAGHATGEKVIPRAARDDDAPLPLADEGPTGQRPGR